MKLDWNALCAGDSVLVHDWTDADMQLLPGVVALLQTTRRSHDFGIRVASNGDRPSVIWPSRLAVHVDPPDPTEACWRCDETADETGCVPDAVRRRAS